MVTTSRADLSGAMWAFKDHGKTHEALFGREHLAGFRWLHERYRFAVHRVHWRQAELSRDSTDASLVRLYHPGVRIWAGYGGFGI